MDKKSVMNTGMICKKAIELGASLAGIAAIKDLKESSSYTIYDKSPYYEGYTGVEWPESVKSVLVLALLAPPSQPELDWWSMDVPGRTPGNRLLMKISGKLRKWLKDNFDIEAAPLPYPVEKGGIFLKDAAVLAGLGVIGENNLLITPEYGTRVRLRALFLEAELQPADPIDFAPCQDCIRPCHRACPENAFRNGSYDVTLCEPEMHRNRTTFYPVKGEVVGIDSPCQVTKFCRECEFSCPVAFC